MLQLRVRAPFAAFRTFTAGALRPTAPFLTPSSAYGLVLNLACIETRLDDGKSPMTVTRTGLPEMEIALGAISKPELHSVFQQLHNYPVGQSAKERAAQCKGNKYNIQPIRREFLSGLDAYICLRGSDSTEKRVLRALRGEQIKAAPLRYGVPFLGDNSFLVDRVDVVGTDGPPANWVRPVKASGVLEASAPFRLTVSIDRKDMARTRSALFEWTSATTGGPPEDCWVAIPGS